MLIHVRLLHFVSKVFTYQVPASLQPDIAVGVLVQVPLRKQIIPAVVEKIMPPLWKSSFDVKDIQAVFPFPQDTLYTKYIESVASYYQIDSLILLRRVQLFLTDQQHEVPILVNNNIQDDGTVLEYTRQQQEVIDQMMPAVIAQHHETFVLHGVTASGKTEVYKKLMQQVLLQGKAVIVLFPEVTLALRFEKIFKSSFSTVDVIGFHSASSAGQKKLLWQLLLDKKPLIIIGVHLPILLPIAHLGLIIVDEEHDHGYQEKKHPKIHTRDMAVLRAWQYKIPIVLGSATPSIQSLWNVQTKGWKLLKMTQRYAGVFPQVRMVSLQKGVKRKFQWLHDELYHAIVDRLQRKEQTIIFLNRRGYSFFVQCPCSFVFECQNCSVSLTLHQDNFLVCHYCGYKQQLPSICPDCNGYSDEFIKHGVGTQQIVSMLSKLFSNANIARADLDTTSKKRSWAQTVEQMNAGEIDILVGTQSITKGYHFPKVTLVGVLWADLNLHFPIYNAAETTLQQLIQVAGRAGRQSSDSLVVIQAFDNHPIFSFINEVDYIKFYEHEVSLRLDAKYPPCSHIAEIEFKSNDAQVVVAISSQVAQQIKNYAQNNNLAVDVLGPVASLVHKIKHVYSYKILLKSASRKQLVDSYRCIVMQDRSVSVSFMMDFVS